MRRGLVAVSLIVIAITISGGGEGDAGLGVTTSSVRGIVLRTRAGTLGQARGGGGRGREVLATGVKSVRTDSFPLHFLCSAALVVVQFGPSLASTMVKGVCSTNFPESPSRKKGKTGNALPLIRKPSRKEKRKT